MRTQRKLTKSHFLLNIYFPVIGLVNWEKKGLNIKTQDFPYLLSLEPELQIWETWFNTSDSKSTKGQFPKRKSKSQLNTWSQSVWLFRPKRESLGIIYHFNRIFQPWRPVFRQRVFLLIPHPLTSNKIIYT